MLNGKCKNTIGNRQYSVGKKNKSSAGSPQSAKEFVLVRILIKAVSRFIKKNDYFVIASESSGEAISNSAYEIATPYRARNDSLNAFPIFHFPSSILLRLCAFFYLKIQCLFPKNFNIRNWYRPSQRRVSHPHASNSIKKNFCDTILILFILVFVLLLAACNPFAPAYDENLSDGSTISDLTTTDGVFRNLQYAYTFKDTIIYGDLISQDFLFSFRNFLGDQVFDDSWGREEEMRATYGLFQNAQRVDLIWNNIILSSQDSLTANIIRGFNLTVTLNPTDILRVDGRVDMTLRKNPETNKWAIIRWVDESNF